MRECKKQKIL